MWQALKDTDLREQSHTLSKLKQLTSLRSFAKLAVKALQALCLENMLRTLLSSTAMLSSPEPICLENAAAGQMAEHQVAAYTGSGQEALRT
jgi:hypothetical protein